MKERKNRLRRLLAVMVTAVIVGGSVNVPSMMSFAEEIAEEDTAGQVKNGENEEEPAADEAVSEVNALLAGLPALELLEGQTAEEQAAVREEVQNAAGRYQALSDEQREQIDAAAKETLESLLAYFNTQEDAGQEEAPEEEEKAEEAVEGFADLSDYIYQCGGLGVLDEPALMSLNEDEEITALSDTAGAKQALLAGIKTWTEKIDVSAYQVTTDELAKLYIEVVNENPELFYVGGSVGYTYLPDSRIAITAVPTYNPAYNQASVQTYNAAFNKAYNEAVPDSSGMSKMQIARACHDYLAQHMYYDNTLQKRDAYNAFVEGTAVCQGYSLAYAAMMKKAGIAFDYATSAEMNHQWNQIQLEDGNWYHVDVTWDDPTPDRIGYVRHLYFLNSDAKIQGEHYGWEGRSCGSTTYDNAYWQGSGVESAIFTIGGSDYYIRSEKAADGNNVDAWLVRRGADGSEEKLETIETIRDAGNGYFYIGCYSGLSYYNRKLYYNGAANIYSVNPFGTGDAGKQKLVYTYDGNDGGFLYGSFVCDDEIQMNIMSGPASGGTVKKVELPAGAVRSVSVTVQPDSAEYGYTTSPEMKAVYTLGDGVTDTPAIEWYRITEDGKEEKMSATSDVCSVDMGLPVGNHTYRVKVHVGDDMVSRDVLFTVSPKRVTPDVTIAGDCTYDEGNPVIPDLEVRVGGEAAPLGINVDYTVEYRNNVDAGTGTAVIKAVEGRNYTWDPIEKTFEILKAVKGEDKKDTQARYGSQGLFDLELPEGAVTGSITVSDPDGILDGEPSVTNGSLSYSLVNNDKKVGKQAVITIPVVDSKNYKPYDILVTVTVTDKEPQSGFRFVRSSENRTYGEADFTAAVTGAAKGSKVTYSIENPEIASIDNSGKVHIKKAGTTKIIAVAAETSEYAQTVISCDLYVKKATLSWADLDELYAADRADSETGDRKLTADATLYGRLKVAGIVKGDDVTFDCTADKLIGTYVNVTAGDQDVRLSWRGAPVTLEGADADNYVLPSLPTVRGRITRIIIQPVDIETEDGTEFRLEIETGITEVPASLENIEKWNTILKINKGMKAELSEIQKSIADENKVVYDVRLMVNVDGKGWEEATEDNFPEDGLVVTIPYPSGTGRDTHTFVAAHLFTAAMNGYKAGDVERIESTAVTKAEEGIRFTVHGLSPIAVGWEEIARTGDGTDGTAANGQGAGTKSTSPKTSDENRGLLYVFLMFLSAAGAGSIWRRRRTWRCHR